MVVEKILVVGKDLQAQQLAQSHTQKLYAADEIHDIWSLVENVEPNLIFFDAGVSHSDITTTLQTMKKKQIDTPAVIMCPPKHKHHAENLLQAGAFDYIHHYEDSHRFNKIIGRLNQTGSCPESGFFMTDCSSSLPIVGKSEAIRKTMNMIRMLAPSACNPILIVGETGTGKELAARAVHILRNGSNQKFVAVNCAALTANLLESELFGHAKGSFTSADREKTGLLELAGEGTIFLDEISEMPIDLQAKLLRVLQEKTFRKVGGTEEINCKATIIASSNRNLLKEVEKKRFRRDLYYRLSICPIMIAPLRSAERKDDILLLAEYFIQNSTICPEKKGTIKGMTKLASETLLRHHWPGNVRELKNVIERAILLEQSDHIGTANLMLHPDCFEDHPGIVETTSPNLENDFSLERAEKELVAKALHESGWQKTRAAALLGITRATLYAKLKQYNIQHPSEQSKAEKEAETISV
jgi:DNA-binding NtrC family response regulator